MIISLHKSKTSHQSDPPNQEDPLGLVKVLKSVMYFTRLIQTRW